jgi:hypothetical protein
MRVLTVQQPFAWSIVAGHKPVENRSWATKYRGPLAVHAGVGRGLEADGLALLERLGIEPPAELVRRAIVGVVDLIDVVNYHNACRQRGLFDGFNVWACPWATGPWCWVLANPRPLDRPIDYRGQQGLCRLPAGLVIEVETMMSAAA